MLPTDYECSGQMSVFDFINEPYKIRKPIRLIELFAGVGSQAMALKSIGANFEHWKVVEFDKYAIASYNAIHGTDFPTIDVTQIHGKDLEIVDVEDFTYLLTYSFPCTDLSVAGKMEGMEEGSGTRSSLLWEVRRLLNECENLPQVLVMENVPQVHGSKNIESFKKWLNFLESKGYTTYWQDMNAKDYGVAQSRNRTIVVSFLGTGIFHFPQGYPLQKIMADYLEDEVNEKFYITTDKAKDLISKLVESGKIPIDRQTDRQSIDLTTKKPRVIDIANCIAARTDRGISNKQAEGSGVLEYERVSPKVECVGNVGGKSTQSRSVYLSEGISPTLQAGMTHGNTVPYINEITRIVDEQDKRNRSDG